jgi:membrane protein required for colicin V production
MIGPLTYLDAAVLAICFISALLAMYRGLTRELMSILSWIAAAGATLYFVLNYKKVAEDMAAQMGTQVAVAQIAIGAVIFLIVLIIVHLITSRISDAILDSSVGMIDRILGFVFGLARGFLLVVIPYMFYASFVPDEQNHLPWVRDGLSTPYIRSTGNVIRGTLETYMPTSLSQPKEEAPQEPVEQPTEPPAQ